MTVSFCNPKLPLMFLLGISNYVFGLLLLQYTELGSMYTPGLSAPSMPSMQHKLIIQVPCHSSRQRQAQREICLHSYRLPPLPLPPQPLYP